MIFKGSGDCTKIDWTFLGGSIANWSFLAFVAFALVGLWLSLRAFSKSEPNANSEPYAKANAPEAD
jgi:disulfide bond formation protein DsbB